MANRKLKALSVVAAIVAMPILVGSAFADEYTGCASINRGLLNAEVAAGSATSRSVKLDAGDLLTFSSERASVAIIGASGATSTLIGGGTATAASFKAVTADTYGFKFANPSGAAGSVRVKCLSTQTEAANAAFLDRRKALLNERDPDRLRIDRAPTPVTEPGKPIASTVGMDDQGRAKNVGFSVSLSEIQAAASGNKKVDPGIVDFWLEGRMQNYGAGGLDSGSNLGVIYLGTRSMLSPDIMLGALAQFDRGVETYSGETPEMAARGWMFGPYMSMKLGSGITFDGRAAWGETENAVASAAIDDTLTERRLLRGKVTSTREFGGWKVAPSVGLVFIEDAVRDSVSNETKAAGTGKVEVLPEVSKRFALDDDAFIEPRAAVGAFVGFDDLQALNPSMPSVRPTDVQLKAEAGVAVGVKDGTNLQASGGVESGTSTANGNWTGRLQLNMPLGQ